MIQNKVNDDETIQSFLCHLKLDFWRELCEDLDVCLDRTL